jgi:hypothetical protein
MVSQQLGQRDGPGVLDLLFGDDRGVSRELRGVDEEAWDPARRDEDRGEFDRLARTGVSGGRGRRRRIGPAGWWESGKTDEPQDDPTSTHRFLLWDKKNPDEDSSGKVPVSFTRDSLHGAA